MTAPGFNQNDGGGNIIAIVYKDQIEFAVWGDTIACQAGDASEPIGEASVRAAVGLGIPSSPASGGVGSGVTYIAFAGPGAPAERHGRPRRGSSAGHEACHELTPKQSLTMMRPQV